MKLLIAFLAILLTLFQQPDHSDKKCVVTQLTVGGLHTDCAGWQAPANEKIIMPAEVNKRLKSGDTFYFMWRSDRWVAEIKEEPQEGFQIPTEFATSQYGGCVVVGLNEDVARARCRVVNLHTFSYASKEKHAGTDGIAELDFPLKPAWRWPLAKDIGTQFYFEQVPRSALGSEEICRVVYSPAQVEMRLQKQVASGNCDD